MTTAPSRRAPTVDPRFAAVDDLLQRNVEDGVELGASLCVIREGEVLLDTWAGWTDRERSVPWQHDTLTPMWSTSKTLVNLATWMLHDDGVLDVDRPVAHYWPDFAQHGKGEVTVLDVLAHTSGVPAWSPKITVDDLYDWERSTADLAASAPWFTPGSAPAYQLLNQGHLLGEVMRRTTGLLPGEIVAQRIAEPLGADVHIGLGPDHDARVAPVVPPRLIELDPQDPDGVAAQALLRPFVHVRESATERWRRGQIPAANGHGNARGVALAQAAISHGGEFGGVRLLRPATVERLLTPHVSGVDLVLGLSLTFGPGWALAGSLPSATAPGRRCYWGGLGGSVVVNDVATATTIAYVMNRLRFEHPVGGTPRVTRPCGDSRFDAYLAAIDGAWKD
ncbi:class A beta-lactamase-related serine hydrolase [Aeromicrobium phragmitis]|uniref:Class A beta-lactamase-related serine hydrolase n=1 Tax=Aeromicrobium phragmitis TaxID=2478914 RepID=A0A3L8PJ03_9ACTN|nr:serine hydrolase domain-containing protein [Aeromicrobium phragmitis]RLV55315.1 class A beta-lactamase-related serine hydrolase [Aeromicrobium phragmitis]